MSAAREAQPSEGPKGPTLRESREADAAQFGWRSTCKEAEATGVRPPVWGDL
jgi:hypothetical protein